MLIFSIIPLLVVSSLGILSEYQNFSSHAKRQREQYIQDKRHYIQTVVHHALKVISQRIHSMSSVHEQLYYHDDFHCINLYVYLGDLFEELFASLEYTGAEYRLDSIRVSLVCNDESIELLYQDNGVGCTNKNAKHSGIGMQLITALSSQLGAHIDMNYNKGCTVRLILPVT